MFSKHALGFRSSALDCRSVRIVISLAVRRRGAKTDGGVPRRITWATPFQTELHIWRILVIFSLDFAAQLEETSVHAQASSAAFSDLWYREMNGLPLVDMDMKLNKISSWFVVSAGVLLGVTSLAKIVSAFGRSAVLGQSDPIFGIPYNYFLISVGLIEMVIAILCLTSVRRNLALGLVAALSANFMAYRIGLWLTDWQGYCPCLGTLTQAIHMSPKRAESWRR
jgi:hypothetical protein